MKKLLTVIFLALSGVLAEAPAPYPPSGFRPAGPAFELPQKQTQNVPQQQYLPVDPRRPLNPNNEYGPPEEEDVSVQGLPTQEQLPIFQGSPINGQQYVGPALQTDLRNLDESFQQSQYQQQQERYREYARQKDLEAARARNNANPTPAVPRQFVPRTTISPDNTLTTTEVPTTTETLDLNEGETLEDANSPKKANSSVEISKQRIQEYPGEFYLSSLAQLKLQPQFVPVQQFGQLRAPLYVQPTQDVSQRQVLAGYDAQTHFAALPSVLAQRQLLQPQGVVQNQQPFQNPGLLIAQQPSTGFGPSPVQPLNQYQPVVQQVQPFPQIQAQPAFVQSQPVNPNIYGQPNPDTEEVEIQSYQPQVFQQPNYQPQEQQNLLLSQAQLSFPTQDQDNINQPQFVGQFPQQQSQFPQQQGQFPQQPAQFPQQQGQFPQQQPAQFPQQGYQGQDAFLQSGLDVNQQGNGVEDRDESDNQDDSVTSVATAFGTRTQPRVYNRYGAPVPVPRAQIDPEYQTTTESADEANTGSPVVAEATAVANGRRKNAKLRSRRVRPIFTLDRSGHLVLAPEQNQAQ
ncbi:bromodomain-containing protein DDB_G0280777-like [Achroia grisella]|uniref:bromodomain-containing protein DDB_G0280777-like n=1 Tax=Achroia grisella TaxID=688607 RepID=UPI0027D322A0|nr:bromodomain-containing protein DDB_G0280777-like [Achroia grisella]